MSNKEEFKIFWYINKIWLLNMNFMTQELII